MAGNGFNGGGGSGFLHTGLELDIQIFHGEFAGDQAREELVAGFGEVLVLF